MAMSGDTFRAVCVILSVLTLLAGGAGMGVSFMFLASSIPGENTAGLAGFVAGSILLGSGLVSLVLLATRPAGREEAPLRRPEQGPDAGPGRTAFTRP
jgi:hypothetical protein